MGGGVEAGEAPWQAVVREEPAYRGRFQPDKALSAGG